MRQLRWTRRVGLVTGVLTASVALIAAPSAGALGADLPLAPLSGTGATATGGDYIVVLKDTPPGSASGSGSGDAGRVRAAAAAAGGTVTRTFDTALQGYAATLTARQLRAVRARAEVAYVQADVPITTRGTQDPAPSWGLDRVDQRSGTRDGAYYHSTEGAGVAAYVVDSGLYGSHPDFRGRVSTGYSAVGGSTEDCDGHGTHVAGTLGGTVYGVAKAVVLHPVRVLNCAGQGSSSGLVAGLEWIAQHHGSGPAVANLSLGPEVPGANPAVEAAVQNLINDGVTVVLAAGNGDAQGVPQSACAYSPGSVLGALNVGATSKTDARASYSNYGSCVDLYAPGEGIVSDFIGRSPDGSYRVATSSGTSMAAPHVAGAAAMYLGRNPFASPAQVHAAIMEASTKDIVTNVSSRWDRHLLFALQKLPVPPNTSSPHKITPGTALLPGRQICSVAGTYCLQERRSDGYLLLYRASDKKLIWSNHSKSHWSTMNRSGNLVSVDNYGRTRWQSGSGGPGQAGDLIVREGGYIEIVRISDNRLLWRSNRPV